jgi:hypothetical protein
MAGFTSEEVQAAVNRFLLKQVSVPQLKTGARDVLALRDVVFDLLTTSLLLRPDSYFYLIWLSKNKLRQLVAQQIASIASIESWAEGVSRPAKLIDSTTELTNAQAALLDLNAGLNARTKGVSGSIGPAVSRFSKSVGNFVSNELNKNVVSGGAVVETGEELRAKISEEWSAVVTRQADLENRVALLSRAVDNLEDVRLPEKSVRDIVSRIRERLVELQEVLEGNEAIQQSREAFLELLTMRSLLAKASTFRAPRLVLAPRTGDPLTGSLIDSEGEEAAVLGTVSAPYNYDVGSSFQLSRDGGVATPTVNLPGSSPAELRSQPITSFPYPPTPPATTQLNCYFDDNPVPKNAFIASGLPSGPSIAANMSVALNPEVTCTWDPTTNQLVFRSANAGDESALRFEATTSTEEDFVAAYFGGYPLEARATPVEIEEVIEAVHTADPQLTAESREEFYASFTGARLAGDPTSIWDRRDSNTDLPTDNTSATVTSPSTNFEAKGIRAGMGIVFTAPFAETLLIESVDGNELTLASPPSTTAVAAAYYIGPDYSSIPTGARVQATGQDARENSGFYRIVSSAVARLVVDRDIPEEDVGLRTEVFTQHLSISARGTTTTSGLGVLVASAPLGLATVPEEPASLTVLSVPGIDFLARGVRVDDLIELTAPSGATYNLTVAAVGVNRLTLSDAVPYEAGSWSFQVKSARYSSFDTLELSLIGYETSAYVAGAFSDLDPLISQLIRGSRYVGTQIETALTTYRSDLETLRDALDNYVVPREVTIDGIVSTMREQGLNRALDILLKADVVSFFSMGADEVSYSTNLVRKAATAGREVTPVSKYARSQQILQELRPVSFQPNPFDPLGEDEELYDESPSGGTFR